MTNPYGTDPAPQPPGLGDPGNQGPQFVAPGAYPQQPGVLYGQPGPYGQPSVYGQPGAYGAHPGPYPQQPSPYGQQSGPYQPGPSPQAGPYAPPGPSPQGAPMPYPSRPASAGGPPQYGQGFQPAPPPRTSRRPSGVLVVLVAVAVLTGLLYTGYELYRGTLDTPVTQATPTRPTRTVAAAPSVARASTATSSATRGAPDCLSGDRITTDDFVATVPASWSCDGDDGDVSITSTRSDAIWVEHDAGSGDPTGDCKAQLEGLGDLTPLPSETWGGRTALAFQATDSGGIFGVRCVVVGSRSWYLMYFPLDAGDDAAVRADVTTLIRTWVWR